MIYFLSVLQLLLLLITASSKQCHERNEIRVSRGRKESSQSNYYYGVISTPNFPEPFPTPFNKSFIIDASDLGNDSQINVYLTQMYLSRGVKFFQLPDYNFCDERETRKIGIRRECRRADDQMHPEIYVDKLHDVLRVSTSCPYLEIQITVPELYGYHYRTRDRFLFDVYGFNITFEIVPEKLGPKNDSCYPRNCSNLGHCYLADNWSDFFCVCAKNHPGRYCEFGPHCDPENNITFCHNGGRCRILGPGEGYCNCEGTGFTGARCEKRNEQPKMSARTGCSDPNECPIEESKPYCSHEPSKQPCSCRPNTKSGRVIPKDWVKYEAIIHIFKNYTVFPNQSTVGYELQTNISNWFKANNVSDLHNVLVNFEPPPLGESHPHPNQLQIHFHGPYNLSDKVRPLLSQYIFVDRSTSSFRRQIPVENNLLLYIMPRVKYKAIGVSKQPRLIIGKSVNIGCTAVTGSSNYFSKRDISFRWFKDGLPINTSISTRHMNIIQTHINKNETMSVLMIDHVSAFDGGRYTCEITDLEFGDQECGMKEVEVILPPQIEIEPMSLTLEKRTLDKGKVITCTDGSYSTYNPHNKSTFFVWSNSSSDLKEEVRNTEMAVVEDIIPQGKLLRILKPELSVSFTCIGTNKDGGERSKTVEVKVLESRNSPSCKQHWEPLLKQSEKDNKLFWEWTAPDSKARIPCPKGFMGYVQRPCLLTSSGKAQWGRSDFSRCISERLRRVNTTLQNAMRGFGDWQNSNGIRLMSKLEAYLNMNQVLYPGEGEKIVAIMEEIVNYVIALGKGKVSSTMFQVFFGTVVKLLKIPNSCVHEKSVLTLWQILTKMTPLGAKLATANEHDKLLKPHIVPSEVLMLQTLPIKAEAKYRELSYPFPQKEAMTNPSLAWLKDNLRLYFPLDSEGLKRDTDSPMMYYLMMIAYRNVSSLLVPNETPLKRVVGLGQRIFRQSIKLVSPVIQISISYGEYYIREGSHIKIHFNLSKEYGSTVSRSAGLVKGGSFPVAKETHYSCGTLDNTSVSTKTDAGRLPWKLDACIMEIHHSSYVECQCENLGIFGLLKVSNFEDEVPEVNNDIPRIIIAGFSFCMLSCGLSGTILCVYLTCQISFNSLYALKLFDCFFIFSAVFIVLLGRSEMPSASWLVWSTCACSFLISSLSVQVTKALRVLLMEATLNLPAFVLPWLKNVSQITLLSAITFSTVLPVWTATVAKIIGENKSNESAFQEASPVFIVFVGTVGIVVIVFLALYYKAVLKTRGDIDGCRQQNPGSTANAFTSEMIWMLTCRMKTLNRSLCLTLVLLVMTLGIVLYENIRYSVFIQYFLGLSATAMGIVMFLSYVSHSEYPIYTSMCKPEKTLRRDPEREAYSDSKGSQRKLYAVSSGVNGNGSIVGTTGLLPPPPPPVKRTSSRQFGEESETLSVSTVEEQSLDTFSTEMSFRSAPPSQSNKVSAFNKRNNRSVRSAGSNTKSSNGSSCRGSRKISSTYSGDCPIPQPIRGHCFISSGDYIMPSIRSTNNTSLHERPAVQTESSATTSSSYNYLPIHDQDEIQKKISHDLSILLPLHEK